MFRLRRVLAQPLRPVVSRAAGGRIADWSARALCTAAQSKEDLMRELLEKALDTQTVTVTDISGLQFHWGGTRSCLVPAGLSSLSHDVYVSNLGRVCRVKHRLPRIRHPRTYSTHPPLAAFVPSLCGRFRPGGCGAMYEIDVESTHVSVICSVVCVSVFGHV